MSSGQRIPREQALVLAEELVTLLSPFCERLEIVGSLRRLRPDVGDIELLAVPKRSEIMAMDLFGERPDQAIVIDSLHERCNELYLDGTLTLRLDKNGHHAFGFKYKRLSYRDVGLDLFCVLAPAQWGVLSLIRTGSADWAHRLVTPVEQGGWCSKGCYFRDGALWTVDAPDPLHTPDEWSVFDYLDLPYTEPEFREVP